MAYDTLEWSIAPVLQETYKEDEHGNEVLAGQTLYATVTPIINDKPIETGWVFDTVALLVREEIGYHLFDLFTCDCGVAGCAGINDEIHLRIGAQEVQLQIPRVEPFLQRFVPEYFPTAEKPLVWTFEARQYRQACTELMTKLQGIEAANPGTPVALWPDDGRPSTKPTESTLTQVANSKKWRANNAARISDGKAYWGPLYQANMRIDIEDASYNLSVRALLDCVDHVLFGVPSEDEVDAEEVLRAQWLDEHIVYFRQRPQELIALFKSLSWESFHEEGYMLHRNAENLTTCLSQQWPDVTVSFVPMENPAEEDWTLL